MPTVQRTSEWESDSWIPGESNHTDVIIILWVKFSEVPRSASLVDANCLRAQWAEDGGRKQTVMRPNLSSETRPVYLLFRFRCQQAHLSSYSFLHSVYFMLRYDASHHLPFRVISWSPQIKVTQSKCQDSFMACRNCVLYSVLTGYHAGC
jgi:hypothetical protein